MQEILFGDTKRINSEQSILSMQQLVSTMLFEVDHVAEIYCYMVFHFV